MRKANRDSHPNAHANDPVGALPIVGGDVTKSSFATAAVLQRCERVEFVTHEFAPGAFGPDLVVMVLEFVGCLAFVRSLVHEETTGSSFLTLANVPSARTSRLQVSRFRWFLGSVGG